MAVWRYGGRNKLVSFSEKTMQTLDVYKKEEGKIWQRKPSPEEGYVHVYLSLTTNRSDKFQSKDPVFFRVNFLQ